VTFGWARKDPSGEVAPSVTGNIDVAAGQTFTTPMAFGLPPDGAHAELTLTVVGTSKTYEFSFPTFS
jgi:hypothetical protein